MKQWARERLRHKVLWGSELDKTKGKADVLQTKKRSWKRENSLNRHLLYWIRKEKEDKGYYIFLFHAPLFAFSFFHFIFNVSVKLHTSQENPVFC